MRLDDLAIRVLDQISAIAVQDTWSARTQGCRVLARRKAQTPGFHADQPHIVILDVRIKGPDPIEPPTDASQYGIWLASDCLRHLRTQFPANDRIEIAH